MIISANSERQTGAIADSIAEQLRESHGVRPMYREGEAGWLLLDYGDVIVHVFMDDTRHYYDLDRLWPSAPRVPVPAVDAGVEAPRVALARSRN